MVVRIPGPKFYPPKPPPDPVEEERMRRTQEKLDRYQARDDAMFITSSLAELTARQEQAFETASSEAFQNETLGHAPAFARRMAGAFDEDVNAVISEAEGREGVKPSADALDLFRRQAGMERQRLFARGAIEEDKLHRMSLLEGTAGSLNSLAGMVAIQPETLDRALTQLDGVITAYGTLAGPEAAEKMRAEQPVRLASAALDGMVHRDPDEALLALDAGQFDDRIDAVMRGRLKERATRRKETLALDEADNTRTVYGEARGESQEGKPAVLWGRQLRWRTLVKVDPEARPDQSSL
jgi:hypothetical protein